MIFDENWMDDVFKLQRKASELSSGQNSIEEIQAFVMDTLEKWKVNEGPLKGDWEPWQWAKRSSEPKSVVDSDIDLTETKAHVLIRVFLPGITDQDNLSVYLRSNILYINGTCNGLTAQACSFNRKIRLPARVTTTDAQATYGNNLLTILLPKAPPEVDEIIPVNFVQD